MTPYGVRAFACPVCKAFVAFDADRCTSCQTALGLHLPTKSMIAITDGAAVIDEQRWVRCTQAALRRLVYQLDDIGLTIDPFWRREGGLAFDLLSSYTTGDKVIIGHANGVITIETSRDSGMVLLAERTRFDVPRDIVPLESYVDEPVERLLVDWRWMSMFFNRVNTAMGKNPLYPFDIPSAVATKLGFVHRVIRESAVHAEVGCV